MLNKLAALALLIAPVGAQAYSQCAIKPLTSAGASIAEEGSDPVVSGTWTYGGFTQDLRVGVVAAAGGALPASTVTLYDGPDKPNLLRLAAAKSNAYAIWRSHRKDDGTNRLMFDVSHKHGAAGSWAKPVDLGVMHSNIPQMSADGANVHIVYMIDNQVYVVSSANAGRRFSAPVLVGPGWGELVITSYGPDVYASWVIKPYGKRAEAMMAVSNDGGKSFHATDLSADRPATTAEPIVAISPDGARVSLVWREGEPLAGFYLQTTDHGLTWSKPLSIDTPARQFMVVDDGSTIYISYLKRFALGDGLDWQVHVTTSTDGGKTFGNTQNLSGPTGISKIVDDQFRPMPWVRPDGAYRLTGVKADGVYFWNGNKSHIYAPAYLGEGMLSAPAGNSAVWLSSTGVVSFATCK